MDADFLLTRGADLVVLGVRLHEFEAGEDELEVIAQDGARIVLYLPPQHVLEETTSGLAADDFIARSQLAGPSRVAYAMPGGFGVRLDAEGVLGACTILAAAETPPGPLDTAIELPWRLAFAPDIERGAQTLHAAGALTSAEGVVGLWLTRLFGPGAAEGQGPPVEELTLLPVDPALANSEDPEGFSIPLSADQRNKIVANGQATPPRTEAVELTALGGSLAAHGEWPGFSWSHRATLGRDQAVVVVEQVRIYPFGHRGILTTTTIRDPDAVLPPDIGTVPPGGTLSLRQVRKLEIFEPRVQAEGPVFGRDFPFSSVELTTAAFTGLGEPEVAYQHPNPPLDVIVWPLAADGQRLQFPLRLRRGEQVLDMAMPLLLVKDFTVAASEGAPEYASLSDPQLTAKLDEIWGASGASAVYMPSALLDLVGSANPQPEDTQLISALNILGPVAGDPFVPSLGRAAEAGQEARWAARVDLPAVRTLLGEATSGDPGGSGTAVLFARDYLENGEAAQLLFETVGEIGVDFTGKANRSGGLTALQLAADGISREHGPVQVEALTNQDPTKAIGSAATLLGFKLQDLIDSLPAPPAIVSELREGRQPVVRMAWKDVALKDFMALRAFPTAEQPKRRSLLSLEVVSDLDKVTTNCDVRDFSLVFPPAGQPLLKLSFAALTYAQETRRGAATPPRVDVKGLEIKFLGPLSLLETLQEHADLGDSGAAIRATPMGVSASFAVPLPTVQCAAFSLSNVVFRSVVDVPFTDDPVGVSIGFASRAAPFSVSVLALSGGGYIDIHIDSSGSRIEASLEFGASISVDFIVASGEVHALGGVRYLQQGDSVELTGYLRIGGSVDVLGLISASIELVIQLAYQLEANRLTGRAKMVLEIDLTLWSDSVEIDSGEWVLQGGGDKPPQPALIPQGGSATAHGDDIFDVIDAAPAEAELEAWRAYRQAVGGHA